jgi:hypothetical protein
MFCLWRHFQSLCGPHVEFENLGLGESYYFK